MFRSITLTNRAAKKVSAGVIWFSKTDVWGNRPKTACITNLIDKRGNFLGMALLSPSSKHYIRLFSRKAVSADREYWKSKILEAYKRREKLRDITNAFRIVYAESDGIPFLIADKYNDVFAFQMTSAGLETIREMTIDIIEDLFSPASIIDKNRAEVVRGAKVIARVFEDDYEFELDVLSGQKTGAYLDYRIIRQKAEELANGNSLDAFCYQGWLTCRIARSSRRVTALDSSASALKAAMKNAEINNYKNITFLKEDVFNYLKNSDERFDFVHLDPPPFAKGYSYVKTAAAGYSKLISSALTLLRPSGHLMVSACSHALTENILEKTVIGAAKKAGREIEVVFRGIQDTRDHPLLKNHSESLYLKAIAVKMLS